MITIQGQNLAFLMQLSAGLPKKKKKKILVAQKKNYWTPAIDLSHEILKISKAC